MNNSALIHIVERLEGFLGKLPESIRRPILRELTPLKELFLQQRAPRFVLTGAHPMPLLEFVARIFAGSTADVARETLTGLFRWQSIALGHHGSIQMLDARGADDAALLLIREELKRHPADIFFFLAAEREPVPGAPNELARLEKMLAWNSEAGADAKLLELRGDEAVAASSTALEQTALTNAPNIRVALIGNFSLGAGLQGAIARVLPNESKVEMARLSGDREVQREIAELLVKSTSAICSAIGMQPIPLADMPILTTLQLVMVSGIMHVSGRERSMRAATEFVGALGANVGIGMALREGTRAVLKLIPGWGNLVCGMVAGAGTYAIGRAATIYFIEGATLGDARRTFLKSKKRRARKVIAETQLVVESAHPEVHVGGALPGVE